ncbi:MAG: hypothetical protein WBA45_09690 [Microthrixaceae bacterium]
MNSVVARFAVVDDETGAQSACWRIWTGSKRPSDETYLAPRSIVADIKVSLHASGECRIGPNEPLRNRLSPDDRRAFSVWSIDPTDLPCRLMSILVHRSELGNNPGAKGQIPVPIPHGVEALELVVALVDPETVAELPLNWSVATLLDRATTGTAVAVFAVPVDARPELLAEAKEGLSAEFDSWRLPVSWPDSSTGWATLAPDEGGEPVLMEIRFEEEVPWRPPVALGGFEGEVRPWSELPNPMPDDLDTCAVVARSVEGSVTVFINDGARCTHGHLREDLELLLKSFHSDGPYSGWDAVADGEGSLRGWVTRLATKSALDRFQGNR